MPPPPRSRHIGDVRILVFLGAFVPNILLTVQLKFLHLNASVPFGLISLGVIRILSKAGVWIEKNYSILVSEEQHQKDK